MINIIACPSLYPLEASFRWLKFWIIISILGDVTIVTKYGTAYEGHGNN